jgi:capsular exopolysaccharide synthesis family protein
MEVSEQAPLSNISIVDKALLPQSPSSPKTLRDISIGVLIALLAGIGTAFYADQQDSRLRTGEEVEEFLRHPSLAIVPDFAKLGNRLGRRQLRDAMGLRNRLRRLEDKSHRYHQMSDHSGAAEIYRMIRTSLLFSRAGAAPQTVLVSSAIDGEGKTFTAGNTALVFAQTGASTLLIDADLRRPKCHSFMLETNTVGLSDVLAGQAELDQAIRPTTVKNLFLLSAGSPVPNPAELLTAAKMRETLDSLRSHYGVLLIDSAPLMLASDTSAMASMVDGVVVVAGANTPRQSVKRACHRLELVGAKVLGIVLNRVNINEPAYREYSCGMFSYHSDDDRSDSA